MVATDNEEFPAGMVQSGGETTVPVKVATVLKGGALGAGDYVLEIHAFQGKSAAWNAVSTIQVPVTLREADSARGSVTGG